MKQVVVNAVVLRRLNFQEADRILTVLTENGERLSVLAKGARRAKSKLAGGIELLCICTLTYVAGRSDIKTLVASKLTHHFRHIAASIEATMLAYDCIKAIDSFTQHGADAGLYELLAKSLEALDGTDSGDHAVVQVWFATRLLGMSGHGVNLERPYGAAAFSDKQAYAFSFDEMAFYPDSNGSYRPRHIKFLRLCAASSQPLNLIAKITDVQVMARDLQPLAKHLLVMNRP